MNKLTIDQVFDIALSSLETPPHPSPLFHHITYYRFHRELIKAIQPEVAVELGVAAAGTSLHMCTGCPTAKVIGVDLSRPDKYNQCITYVEKHYPNWEFWQPMDTVKAAQKMWLRYQRPVIGHFYIDADHRKEQVYKELRAYKRLLVPGAIIVFDDLYLTEDMNQMWEGLPFSQKIRLDPLHVEVGYGAVVYDPAEIRGW